MKIPFTVTDFSGGMKGKKGQLNSADTKHVQDLNNMLVERNNTLKSRNGVESLPITLLANDKMLPFESHGKKYYFVYDPLLVLKYKALVDGPSYSHSAGGQRHVDIFSKYNSTLSPLDYLSREAFDREHLVRQPYDFPYAGLTYIEADGGALNAPQDDIAKWSVFDTYTGLGATDELDLHLFLRKLTMESSPTFVMSEANHQMQDASLLYQKVQAHPVVENTFWWNRMFILDEDFNVITTEIDIANFVSYDSGHTLLTPIPIMDTEVRGATHNELQTIRETRYGGSDLEYDVEVMKQGIMFFNREGKLPNMFIQLNDKGQTDGVLRDFRTLYLDEVSNGIFKTAPYFTTAQYTAQDLFDVGRLRIEMEYIKDFTTGGNPPLYFTIGNYFQAVALINQFTFVNQSKDLANNPNVKFSYNVKDPENKTDVVKAFLPLTSDASPSVDNDGIRLDSPDGQVVFASPSLASLDRDYLFPHDGTTSLVWQNTDLASELPFIFSPNLMIYSEDGDIEPISGMRNRYASPILTLMSNNASAVDFALVPISRYAGGGIGKFNLDEAAILPSRITSITSDTVVVSQTSAYLPVVVYAQVFGLYKFDAASDLEFTVVDTEFPARFGYSVFSGSAETFYALQEFKIFSEIYLGSTNSESTSWYGTTSSSSSEYSFRIFVDNGGSRYSVITTATSQISKAIGFNSNGYFSAVSEFSGRLFLASISAPNRLVYSSTTDYLEFSTVRSLVNAESDVVATRGARDILDNESIAALYESNNSLRAITNKRIFSIGIDGETGLVNKSNPSDIVTSGKSPVTINNFSYFVSGDNRDVLLAVFSDKTQRFEYYSVFSAINVDDETEILSLTAIDSAYRLVVLTGQGLYIGTIIQANQVAWSRLTFNFDTSSVATTKEALYIQSVDTAYKLQFLTNSDLEDGVYASMKMLAPTALANLVNVAKTNINYNGMRLHDVTIVGSFVSETQSGSDARELATGALGDIVDTGNKNFNDIYDSIEFSFEGGQNRIVYLRGSLGV